MEEYSVEFPTTLIQQRNVKLLKILKLLLFVDLILASLCIVFGSVCTGMSYNNYKFYGYYYGACFEASGIWVGVLCIFTSTLVILILKPNTNGRCMLIILFTVLIVSIIGCGILIAFSSAWISHTRYSITFRWYERSIIVIFIFNTMILLISIALCKSTKI